MSSGQNYDHSITPTLESLVSSLLTTALEALYDFKLVQWIVQMKILLFYAPSFWFKTYQKVLEHVEDQELEADCQKAVVVFYHVEADDVERRGKVLTKFLKNIKWLAGKFDSKNVVLHSFNHLSKSKAPADFAEELVLDTRDRLERAGYSVTVTPFGYLNEWKLHVAGESLAKVFKEI